jgi:hypothetical protein
MRLDLDTKEEMDWKVGIHQLRLVIPFVIRISDWVLRIFAARPRRQI